MITASITRGTTLRNNFHDTARYTSKSMTELSRSSDRINAGVASKAEKAFASRVRQALCGSQTCTCSCSVFGER